MSKFRKKPVVVDAVRWTGSNGSEIMDFLGYELPWRTNPDDTLTIPTLEGDHLARPGDWIIRGVQGEFYPCKPEIFKATYEPVAASPSAGGRGA